MSAPDGRIQHPIRCDSQTQIREFRLYSRKKDARTGKRRNLGTFSTMEKAKQHEREVQFFKKRG